MPGKEENMIETLPGYDAICEFGNLYNAHLKARRGKRDLTETIDFENKLGENLIFLSEQLQNGTYRVRGYYSFMVYDPKKRTIHALHYRDRVVQHCICDEVLSKRIEPKLIYDNAACRKNKGILFAIKRLSSFLSEYYKKNGAEGYFLRFDIRKFFDNIDHEILKQKLTKVIDDRRVLQLLYYFIDSYEVMRKDGRSAGIPLGNQSSQWFALYYLDSLDRLIKEKLRIKYYVRYMDDAVMIFENKEYLKECLSVMEKHVNEDLRLEFNEKTQIFPIKNGVDFIGFHFYLTDSGKVIRKLRTQNKKKMKRRLKKLCAEYDAGEKTKEEIKQVESSYKAHLSHGHTYKLMRKTMKGLEKITTCESSISD